LVPTFRMSVLRLVTVFEGECLDTAFSQGTGGPVLRLVGWPLPFCLALVPFVFVPLDFWQWQGNMRRAVLAHERVHHRQQRAVGVLRFLLLYVFDVRFRWRIERRGYEREMWELRRCGVQPRPERYARAVSSSLYWGMIDSTAARRWAERAVDRC
jgi:hypothetical protein